MQQYGPGKGDFNQWFTDGGNGTWTCKQTGAAIIGGNLALYQSLSMDGNTLPIIGLPLEAEQYVGAHHSLQKFERALIVYNADDPNDRQPGLGTSHLAFIDWKTSDELQQAQAQITDLQNQLANKTQLSPLVKSDMATIAQIAEKYK